MLLAGVSGCVDVVALVYAGVFVANQTGNLVVVAAASLSSSTRVVLAVTALIAFAAAVVGGAYARRGIRRRWSQHAARMALLGAEVVLVLVAGVLILVRPSDRGLALLVPVALLAASQGAQAILITRLLGSGIRTVAATGPLTDTLVNSVEAVADPEQRRDPTRRRLLMLAGATPGGYAVGAALAALAARTGLHISLLLASVLAAVAAVVLTRVERDGLDVA